MTLMKQRTGCFGITPSGLVDFSILQGHYGGQKQQVNLQRELPRFWLPTFNRYLHSESQRKTVFSLDNAGSATSTSPALQ